MPAQVSFPILNRNAREHLVETLEEVRVRDVNFAKLRRADLLDVSRPVEVSHHVFQVRWRHFVILLRSIATRDAIQRDLCELCLNSHYGLRFSRRLVSIIAEQLEHVGDVLHVGVTCALRFCVVFEIEVAVGKSKATLARDGDNAVALLEILDRAETE